MKIIKTYLGNLIIVNNIVSINWRMFCDGDEEKYNLMDSNKAYLDGFLTVTDCSGAERVIGEYPSEIAQDIVNEIEKWLLDSENKKAFRMPHYDDFEEDDEEFDDFEEDDEEFDDFEKNEEAE